MAIILIMQQVNLNNIDLNLLVALDVLLDECHVTKSADRLDISQPAMSRTLARLRKTFDDPLLVRVPNGYERTARAEDLIEPLKEALDQVRQTFAKPSFDPSTATDVFRISTLDYAEVVVLPTFMDLVTRKAPYSQIEIVRRGFFSLDEVLDGRADISFGVIPSSVPKHCVVQPLFEDSYVCVMRKNHPLAKTEFTMDEYLEYPHSIVQTGVGSGSHVDDVLRRSGCNRRIAKCSPYFIGSLLSIGNTDLIETLPKRMVEPLLRAGNLVMRDLPFPVEPVTLSQIWHARNSNNISHRWFRHQISLAAQSVSDNR